MHRLLLAAAVIAPMATFGPATQAQTAQAPATPAPTATQGRGMQIDASHMPAKRLIDRDVYSTDNVEIGEIEDLIIDPAQGRIVTVVIEVENRLGLTDKYVSVPLNQLRFTPGERRITINMTRDQVRSLQGIDYRD
ncbi:PRC-barrel domain-containing protein [Roseomonas sp. OT10]|uniref:PRC-barrel domain-containing protein n=1 Tax=Roseomonas cutis TaxID=2897332 RepID=UPI001E646233|nr:PRC-barrel domain-containing protein [Roseomonas sp. OT10]UFN48255.1 PRC-barrel domain-containing protein [Roseomonas sp. OT10]